jgi:acyl dehydratase
MTGTGPQATNGLLYLDNFHVGQKFFASQRYLVGPEDIKAFATRFDPQPFHLDENAAAETLFRGLVASGWHTAAITMRLFVTSGLPIAGGIIGAGAQIAWPRPVRPGDELYVESEVTEVRPSRSKPAQGVLTMVITTRNQRDEVVQTLTTSLIGPVHTSDLR